MFYFDHKKLNNAVKHKQMFKDEINGIELCKKINVSRSTLHRLKVGKEIDMQTFLKICSYLEIQPDVFFTTINPENNSK